MGDPKVWKQAENDLEKALKDAKVKYGIKKKDGAFYGPKIDIHITDSQDRDWQLATIQLDFQIPEKMELEYVDKDGLPKRPIIIHRAILGSLERFIGILTEHYQGAFPLWLSPVQVMLMPITDKQESTAKKIAEELKKQGIRAELDNRPERLQAKIRDSSLQKVPYLGIIGNREIEASSLSVRTREGKDLGALKVPDFLNKLKEEIDKKI
ncbi:MAG: Threonine-tRNA ligase [Candidatus Levybacteria bacterium GW2011_GWA1_37_16]|nr:MAG: Threonine-tRNA ligase [Candidatus Levybacteria bacterium GW2011_GWA1_37_16]